MELNGLDFYNQRVLVFLETDPQTNKYNQVILDAEMYKAMTDTLCKKTGKMLEDKIEEVQMTTSEEEIDLPDLKEIS